MPGNVSGPFGDPSRGDSEQPVRDALVRLENGQAVLGAALAALGGQLAELSQRITDAESEAEAILRRAAAPEPRPSPAPHRKPRRGDTFLRVVRATAIAVGLGAVFLAAMAPQRMHQQRYSPRCTISCSRPVAHHAPTGRPPAAP